MDTVEAELAETNATFMPVEQFLQDRFDMITDADLKKKLEQIQSEVFDSINTLGIIVQYLRLEGINNNEVFEHLASRLREFRDLLERYGKAMAGLRSVNSQQLPVSEEMAYDIRNLEQYLVQWAHLNQQVIDEIAKDGVTTDSAEVESDSSGGA